MYELSGHRILPYRTPLDFNRKNNTICFCACVYFCSYASRPCFCATGSALSTSHTSTSIPHKQAIHLSRNSLCDIHHPEYPLDVRHSILERRNGRETCFTSQRVYSRPTLRTGRRRRVRDERGHTRGQRNTTAEVLGRCGEMHPNQRKRQRHRGQEIGQEGMGNLSSRVQR